MDFCGGRERQQQINVKVPKAMMAASNVDVEILVRIAFPLSLIVSKMFNFEDVYLCPAMKVPDM